MNIVVTVVTKELTDALRDRRSLISALLFPLMGPLLITGMMRVMAEQIHTDQPIPLPVVGQSHAPHLMAHLRQHGFQPEDPPEEVLAAVQSGTATLVLEIPPDYSDNFRSGLGVSLPVLFDSSNLRSRSHAVRLRSSVQHFASKIASLRLLQRGIDPQIVQPMYTLDVDVSTPQEQAGNILSMLPMFSVMALFMGGMYLATDTTAGERERKSLEPLLSTGAPLYPLVVGKWLATMTVANVALFVNLAGSAFVLHALPLEAFGGSVQLSIAGVFFLFSAIAPLSLLSTSTQMLVAIFAKSYREAQSYLSGFMLLPTLPGVFFLIQPPDAHPFVNLIPVLGQQIQMIDFLTGHGLDLGQVVGSAMICVILSFAAIHAIVWCLRQEHIVFGN